MKAEDFKMKSHIGKYDDGRPLKKFSISYESEKLTAKKLKLCLSLSPFSENAFLTLEENNGLYDDDYSTNTIEIFNPGLTFDYREDNLIDDINKSIERVKKWFYDDKETISFIENEFFKDKKKRTRN